MAQKVTLFDPHPGIGGNMPSLPQPLRQIAQKLDGESNLTLEEAVEDITQVASKVRGIVSVAKEEQYIAVLVDDGSLVYTYRLLRYKDNG